MGDIERKAADHGINVFRGLLEDDGEHYEDALRVGMQAAAGEALRHANQGAVEARDDLRAALLEAINWSYGLGPTPERRDEIKHLARGGGRP